jgi:hypothetical protein
MCSVGHTELFSKRVSASQSDLRHKFYENKFRGTPNTHTPLLHTAILHTPIQGTSVRFSLNLSKGIVAPDLLQKTFRSRYIIKEMVLLKLFPGL